MLSITLDLFLKLTDRCIGLVKHREETDRNMYADFVAPAFIDFEAVHKNYLDSFRQYREMIENPDFALNEKHPVVNVIAKDSLFSGDLRSKVFALYDLKSDPLVGKFIEAIYNYMLRASDTNPLIGFRTRADRYNQNFMMFNGVRIDFNNGLRVILTARSSQDEKRVKALSTLDGIVNRIQENYRAVVTEYAALKRRLLTPK